ncbi:Ski complex subunit Rec14 [Coemansia sp. IMI 209128]|nr:Ski complex subunit Rec14 [Coemansia sp. IMI 209128]
MSSALYAAGAAIDQAHEDDIWHSCWVPGKHRLLTAGSDEVTKIWDAQSGECVGQLKGGNYAITSVDVNRQGTRALTSSMDNTMRVWDISTRKSLNDAKPLLTLNAGPINAWRSRFVSRKGEADTPDDLLASSTDSGTVKLWSLEDGRPIRELNTSRPNFMYALAVSPDGTKVACAGVGSHVYVFDTEAGMLLCTFSGHSDNVRSVSFSADSSLLVTASDDKQIQLHDVRHGSPVTTLLGHHGWVLTAEMHPSGAYIASGSIDTKVKIWDMAQRACVETHSQHSQAVWGVAWQRSSDDVPITRPMLASVSEDCSVHLYDPLLA